MHIRTIITIIHWWWWCVCVCLDGWRRSCATNLLCAVSSSHIPHSSPLIGSNQEKMHEKSGEHTTALSLPPTIAYKHSSPQPPEEIFKYRRRKSTENTQLDAFVPVHFVCRTRKLCLAADEKSAMKNRPNEIEHTKPGARMENHLEKFQKPLCHSE